jgi:hypothetical protein
MHLTAEGDVARPLKMLATCSGCCAVSSACAYPSTVICFIEMASDEKHSFF